MLKTSLFFIVRSSELASEDKASKYKIPPGEDWQHRKCKDRAPHQLTTLQEPQNCDFCCIVKKQNSVT